jgi:carbon storage regulator
MTYLFSQYDVFFDLSCYLQSWGDVHMLIIGRKRDQKIIIADDIEITVIEIGRNRVRFGIQAPKEVQIHTRLQHLPSEADHGNGSPPEAPQEAPVSEHQQPVKTFRVVASGGRRS